MTMTEVFLDSETTGLDARIHDTFELAWAVDDGPIRDTILPHTLDHATPEALAVNRYYERGVDQFAPTGQWGWRDSVAEFCQAARGATIVGANPAFDQEALTKKIGYRPWHYRLLDVETYAKGVLRLDRIMGLNSLADLLADHGWKIATPDHTAPADVACLRDVYRALVTIRVRMGEPDMAPVSAG